MVEWCQKLTIGGLLAVSCFVAAQAAQISSPPTAALQARAERAELEDIRAHERLNSLQDRVTNLEALKVDSRLTILEQYWIAAQKRDQSQMTMLYSIVGGLVVLALGQYLNLRESVRHRKGGGGGR